MLQEDAMTDALRSLAAELDELGNEAEERVPEIPDFQLTDVLGRGGMGTVYLAEQLSLGREVALKVVNSSVATSATLPAEARTVAQLHHPNIVQVYAAGTAQDQSWFAMELMRGKTANRSLFASAEDVARLGVQIAEALSYAHHCGVIHRDVKPSNIFIGENGMAKLGDFVAFQAAIELLKESNQLHVIEEVYRKAKSSQCCEGPVPNYVQEIYAPFTAEQLSAKIAELLSPVGICAEVSVIFQTIEGLHEACPNHTGDWYFTGNYPTPGGAKVCNRAFINYIEGRNERAY